MWVNPDPEHLVWREAVSKVADEYGAEMVKEVQGWDSGGKSTLVFQLGARTGVLAGVHFLLEEDDPSGRLDALAEEAGDPDSVVDEVLHRARWAVTLAFLARRATTPDGRKQAERTLSVGVVADSRRRLSSEAEALWSKYSASFGDPDRDVPTGPWFTALGKYICVPIARPEGTAAQEDPIGYARYWLGVGLESAETLARRAAG